MGERLEGLAAELQEVRRLDRATASPIRARLFETTVVRRGLAAAFRHATWVAISLGAPASCARSIAACISS